MLKKGKPMNKTTNRAKNSIIAALILALGAFTFGRISLAVGAPPQTPTDLSVSPASNTEMNLSWTAATDPDTSASNLTYLVYRDGIQVATTTAGSISYADTALNEGTNYSYTLIAVDPEGNQSSATTDVAGSTYYGEIPAAPANLTATPMSSSEIHLAWDAAATTSTSTLVSEYQIYRGGTKVATSSLASYHDTGLLPSTMYSYTVTAKTQGGNTSVMSAIVNATTLASSTPETPPAGEPTTTPMNISGWIAIPLSVYNSVWNASSTPAGSSTPITYDAHNYPMWNGHYITCEGFIDDDMAHHTTLSTDTDPAHNIGKNCPGGAPQQPAINQWNMWNMMQHDNNWQGVMPLKFWMHDNTSLSEWVVIPLTKESLGKLYNRM